MNIEYLIILSVLFTLLLMLIQRTESTKRRIVIFVMIIPAILIRNWIDYRDKETEALIALVIALLLNFMFWVLIGRYNPVGSSEQIRVLSMDD
jgi:dipeptide/tripeptide permease